MLHWMTQVECNKQNTWNISNKINIPTNQLVTRHTHKHIHTYRQFTQCFHQQPQHITRNTPQCIYKLTICWLTDIRRIECISSALPPLLTNTLHQLHLDRFMLINRQKSASYNRFGSSLRLGCVCNYSKFKAWNSHTLLRERSKKVISASRKTMCGTFKKRFDSADNDSRAKFTTRLYNI